MEITIANEVKRSLDDLGRTEDVKFSPDDSRLAIAGFSKNKILIVDINIEAVGSDKRITLIDSIEITSPQFQSPHGLSFLNDESIIIANRNGDVIILELPPRGAGIKNIELNPLVTIRADSTHYIKTPGSISVSLIELDLYEILICNNYVNYVTRHILDGRNQFQVISSAILLREGIDIPDSVAINKKGDWIAISNHNTHNVYLYENTPQLNSLSRPDSKLSNVIYPHGLRFTADDNYLLVADAGAPYVYLYSKIKGSWIGVRDPISKIRVMDDETFLRGQYNPQEGGPKGIDIDSNMRVLVTTSEHQVLAFFDMEKVIKKQDSNTFVSSTYGYDDICIEDTKYHENQIELHNIPNQDGSSNSIELSRTKLIREIERGNYLHSWKEASLIASYEQQIKNIYQTRSWKITAPLRWVYDKLKNIKVKLG